jgi:hypothetical protein
MSGKSHTNRAEINKEVIICFSSFWLYVTVHILKMIWFRSNVFKR